MKMVVAICVGAMLGALLRWKLGNQFNALTGSIAMGTLIANTLGCFLIGIIVAGLYFKAAIPGTTQAFIVTGFLGSLTTFSSYISEVFNKVLADKYLQAMGVLVGHLTCGAGAILLGFIIGKMIFGK